MKKKDNSLNILFLNMHLPSDENDAEYRTEQLKNILQKISDLKSSDDLKLVNDNTVVIIGGDLNYRINKVGEDQLIDVLNSKKLPNNWSLNEFAYNKPPFTCKFKKSPSNPDDVSKYNTCRRLKVTALEPHTDLKLKPTQSHHPQFLSHALGYLENCAEMKRRPSRCDRFLFKDSTSHSVDTELYEGFYVNGSNSDHNSIFGFATIGSRMKLLQKTLKQTLRQGGKKCRKTHKNTRKHK